MDDHHDDLALHRVLDTYRVAPARPSLLENIVATAARQPRMAAPRRHWAKDAALLAATALFGFWCGAMSLQNISIKSTTSGVSLDNVIWSPLSAEEVML